MRIGFIALLSLLLIAAVNKPQIAARVQLKSSRHSSGNWSLPGQKIILAWAQHQKILLAVLRL